MARDPVEVPMVIDGRAVTTGNTSALKAPHDHTLVLGHWHTGTHTHVQQAITAALGAGPSWAGLPFTARAAVFLRAAELLATRYRPVLNAATMLGQSKTAHQAEIDAACELIDFFRFNCAFAERMLAEQPLSAPGVWNLTDWRPLEGFVLAVSPFNFTSIAANLPCAPALLGNTVVWKPAETAMLSAHWIMRLLDEAGLPPGVVNMVSGDPAALVGEALASEHLAGVHFTGSTQVFRGLCQRVAEGLGRYRSLPRMVGETGGKDFIFAHPSADLDALAVAVVRGGYEYQGQKCSAASRVFVPRSLHKPLVERCLGMLSEVRTGDVADFANYLGAVIDGRAFRRITGYVSRARAHAACTVLAGSADDARGWFVTPHLVEVRDPGHELLREELFGPVVALFPYDDDRYDEALALCDRGSPYALTGALFARDRRALEHGLRALRNAAGNFYLNDKPTGAVVGQQPFGGARASGTNDKAGSMLNLLRWVSPRTVKETFAPPTDWRYPFLG
jgi:1-pyrroline-5-carboxylate dehydrogenase